MKISRYEKRISSFEIMILSVLFDEFPVQIESSRYDMRISWYEMRILSVQYEDYVGHNLRTSRYEMVISRYGMMLSRYDVVPYDRGHREQSSKQLNQKNYI